ncbi:tetratricopeptide repeat protein, partial [Candidatus Poribacteria bacterium]|nr:tetratricopeptide repeat protein [Candidatus Poribacteria bacterium]
MIGRGKSHVVAFLLCLILFTLALSPLLLAQDEVNDAKIIERYKLMLNRKPKEGSTFDRLYQFYLEGSGLDAMVADYQAEVQAKPDNPNPQLILGHIYKRLGKDAEAVKAYQRAVELAPNNYYPHFALGQAYAILLQHENAIAALNQAAKIAEETQTATPEDLTAIYKALGRAYFRRDRVDAAILAWTKIAELDPENIFTRIELADLLREQELYEQAIAQHEAIIEIKAEDPYRVCLSRREIGNIHEAKGDYEAAIESYDTALALTAPGNWLRKDLQHRIIGIYAADGNWEGLIEYYQKKLETTPNEPEILGLLAAAYIENQQPEEGLTTYQKAVELAPTDANLRLNLIAAFRNAERFEDAAAAYESLSEQDPDDFGIYRELGELYLHLEDEDKARVTYQRMIDRDPENAGTHLILAEIYASNEWMADAAAAYQRVISLAPSNLDYIEYFGEFYFRQGNREKAIDTWNMMVAADKEVAENYERLAKLLDTKNYRTEAITASRKAVELMPDVYRYREALAKLLMKNEDYDAALTEYTEAAKLAPNAFFAEEMDNQRIELYRRQGTLVEKIETVETELETSGLSDADIFAKQKRLAKMYLKLGNITYALEVLLNAKAHQPDDIIVNRWLAEVYTKQNRRDDANAVYKHLITIDSANTREYYTNIARAHLNVMDFDAATEASKQVIAHSPRNPEGHQMLAEIAKQSGNYDSAIDSLKEALRLRPEAIDIRSELAATYKLSGKPRQALAQYWRCWELSDTVNDKLAFVKPLSEAYYDLGRRGEFEEKLKHLSKSNTSSVGPVIALAELYRMEGDLPSARFQLARALDRERENPDLLAQLVNISVDLGDNQDALTYQQRLVKVEPDPSHQRRLGELLFDAGREQEAIQAWTKLLHAKNQTLEAEVKLAILLIRHGLPDEALFVLERAAEKITGPDAHTALYQLGVVLVSMNEFDRARTYFQRILDMPKPPKNATQRAKTATTYTTSGPPGMDTDKFQLARNLLYRVQDQSFGGRSGQAWRPNNFEETQAAALVHLVTIVQRQGKLKELIQHLEADAAANLKDIQMLETLAQLYILTNDTEKTDKITERLIAASPDDLTYQAIRLNRVIQEDSDAETVEKHLNAIMGLPSEAKLWYTAQYVNKLYHEDKKADAAQLLNELENTKVTDLNASSMLVSTLLLMGRTDAAERIIANVPIPPQQQQWQHRQLYTNVIDAYIRKEQIDKAVALFWSYCERTKPQTTNTRRVAKLTTSSSYYSGYAPIQSNYPSPTTYYDQGRLDYLQHFYGGLWSRDLQEALYTKLRAELDVGEGINRIYPGLALSYCHWWDGQRDKAQEILSTLQKEFPNDLTLKLNTIFASIQTGQHAEALELLEELAGTDPRNRRQYYNLTLQLALHTGNTVVVRELIAKLLNSPSSARELYEFSRKLQDAGLTQHATAVVNKAMNLAMGMRDPNFLMRLSEHLEDLGRGQDAAQLAERALRFANQRDRYGSTLSRWNFQQATHLVSHSKAVRAREPQLVEATEKNPNSLQAHLKLAAFYESTNQIEKASAAFEAALSLRPKDSTTRQRYASMLQRSGKVKDAVTQYMILLKDNPNVPGYRAWDVVRTFVQADRVDDLVSLAKGMITPSIGRDFGNEFARYAARECTNNNNPKAAAEIYEKLIEAFPNRTYNHRYLASAYAAAGEREKAIQFLRQQLKPEEIASQVQTILQLAEFYKTSGALEDFIKAYETKLTEKPDDSVLLYLIASMQIMANDLEAADSLVSELFDDSDSINIEYLNNLADAYRRAGDSERELHLLASTVDKLDPHTWRFPDTCQKLGLAYSQKGEQEKARDAFRKMGTIRMLQRGYDIWEKEGVANIYMQHEMWDDAEGIYTEIVNDLSVQSYDRDQAQRQLMTIKQRRGDFSNATQLTEKTQEMNIGAQRALAKESMQQGETKQAIEIYEQVVKMMPEDLESRAELATLYSRRNQHDTATDIWNTLLETDPGNTKYQDGFVRTYQVSGDIGKAFELAQRYINTDPESGVHYVRLAKLHAAEEQVEDAITAYEKAIELAPGNAQAYHDLARLHLQIDDTDAAEKAFKKAIQYTGQDWERQDIERELINLYYREGKLEEMITQAEAGGTLTFQMQRERALRYRNAGDLEKSVSAYKKAIDMTSDRFDRRRINEDLLEIYVKLGKTDLTVEIYETLAISDSRDRARDRLISTFKNEGKLEELKTLFKNRWEKSEANPAVLELLAQIYRDANDHEQAAETYLALSEAQPSNVRSFYYAAAALNNNGQPELAKKMLLQGEAALSTSNEKSSMYFLRTLGDICYEGKMYAAAIKLADAAIVESARYRFYGGSPLEPMYELKGKSYLREKRYEDAFNAYRQKAAVARYDSDREAAEASMRRAAQQGNLYEKWIPEQLKQVRENPDDLDARFTLAQSYESNDMISEAIAEYQKISELQPDSWQWHKKLGDLYDKQSQQQRETGEVIEGTALFLDGNSSFVEIGGTDVLNNVTQQATISVWIQPTDFPNRYAPIIFKGDERTSNFSHRSYILYLRENGKIQIASSPNGRGQRSFYTASDTIQLNRWYHIAGVIDGKRDVMRLFINGVEVGTTDFKGQDSIYQSRKPLRIGWTHEEERPTQSPFVGFIDEVRIWNVARTGAEIRSDMNSQLTGDEPGLVAYWKFDKATDGIIPDASRNKNKGRLMGNARLASYTRPIFESFNPEQLTEATAAYEKAIQFDPNSYELYRLLAQIYKNGEHPLDAEQVYRRALDASLTQSEYDTAVKAILNLYDDEKQEDKHIALLEELTPKMPNSTALHELLGDAYKKAGDTEKAKIAYNCWIKLRQREINREQRYWYYSDFAEKLLNKGLYPETALKFAKRAAQRSTGSSYILTLGHAYLANEQYNEALEEFILGLNTRTTGSAHRDVFSRIAETGKKMKNQARYLEMLNKLVDAMSHNLSAHLHLSLVLAEFYRENDMPEKAKAHIQSTGFITEDAWWTLGPFDNTSGIGYDTAYIPEDVTQIDTTTIYNGINGQVRWEKNADKTLEGYIGLGKDIDWRVAYAFATITSPDERKVQLRFDSDDQGKIWLNGEEVFAHTRTSLAEIDRDIIPVTLKPGENSILVKVCEEELHWGFYLRITDTDGKPFDDLKII